jgi:hypothetical protein
MVKLWTYHPSNFVLNTPGAIIDPRLGINMNFRAPGFRYPVVWKQLATLLGANQFLWCFTKHGCFVRVEQNYDSVEWELTVPDSEILGFIDAYLWEQIVFSASDDWSRLFIDGPVEPSVGISALVRFPLQAGRMKCNGYPPMTIPRPI